MRAPVTESYPGKAEEGLGSKAGGLGARGQAERSWERRGETERAVKMGKDGREGNRGKEREKQEKAISKHFKPE